MPHKYSFEKLNVWHESKELTIKIYTLTNDFPQEEYSLSSQLKRAAISVNSNIAEGSSRNTAKDQAHFYGMAYSSLMELLNQCLIAQALNFISLKELSEIRNKVEKTSNMLNALRNSTYT